MQNCYDPVDHLLNYILEVMVHRLVFTKLSDMLITDVQHSDTEVAYASDDDLTRLFEVSDYTYVC